MYLGEQKRTKNAVSKYKRSPGLYYVKKQDVQQCVQNAFEKKEGNNTNFYFYLVVFALKNSTPLYVILEAHECIISLCQTALLVPILHHPCIYNLAMASLEVDCTFPPLDIAWPCDLL